MNKMKVLLTGSTGLVGSMIQLKMQGSVDLYSVGRDKPSNNVNGKHYFNIDLRDTFELNNLVKQILPDVIIHCAAQIPSPSYADSIELAKTNERIDASVFQAVSQMTCKLIYMSSTIVYGLPSFVLNIDETFSVTNSSYYAAQKINAEQYILQNFENGLILRLNAPYGLNMRIDTVLTKFIKLALRNEPILLHGSGNRMQDFTNTKDIAGLIHKLIIDCNTEHGVFNLSAGMPISMKELATKIIKVTGSSSIVLNSGSLDEQEDYWASYSIDRAKQLLNWNPEISLEMGIRELMNNILLN
jgi:nucleoside-diphosphate-sugar epimerase